MKIEKINDNQIRCTLTKADLESRDIKISELAYGSEKAKILFREMVNQAKQEFGFSADNTPLMIEAVPLKNDSLSLVLSKVDDPEELDTRFAKLTPSVEDLEDAAELEAEIKNKYGHGANDILDMMENFKKALAENLLPNLNELKKNLSENNPEVKNNSETHTAESITIVYIFDSIDLVIDLSFVLVDKYHGLNNLYLNKSDNKFYLTLEKSDHTPEEFNKICNIACEFGNHVLYKKPIVEFMNEHYELILESTALQELSNCRK